MKSPQRIKKEQEKAIGNRVHRYELQKDEIKELILEIYQIEKGAKFPTIIDLAIDASLKNPSKEFYIFEQLKIQCYRNQHTTMNKKQVLKSNYKKYINKATSEKIGIKTSYGTTPMIFFLVAELMAFEREDLEKIEEEIDEIKKAIGQTEAEEEKKGEGRKRL